MMTIAVQDDNDVGGIDDGNDVGCGSGNAKVVEYLCLKIFCKTITQP